MAVKNRPRGIESQRIHKLWRNDIIRSSRDHFAQRLLPADDRERVRCGPVRALGVSWIIPSERGQPVVESMVDSDAWRVKGTGVRICRGVVRQAGVTQSGQDDVA